MAEAVFTAAESADIIIKAAAVSDYRPQKESPQKIKKIHDEEIIVLKKNPDILKELGKNKKDKILVGFAAETTDLEAYAEKKMREKNLDMIVANRVGVPESGFAADTNRVVVFYSDGNREELPLIGKDELAHMILDRIASRFFPQTLEPGGQTIV
jgi:phosphopantothenoylcysteine decarboxylase/phosphopantothenate--cysteine ligase